MYRVYVHVTMIQNIKVKNICIASQTGSLKILVRIAYPRAEPVRVAIAMPTTHGFLVNISVRMA